MQFDPFPSNFFLSNSKLQANLIFPNFKNFLSKTAQSPTKNSHFLLCLREILIFHETNILWSHIFVKKIILFKSEIIKWKLQYLIYGQYINNKKIQFMHFFNGFKKVYKLLLSNGHEFPINAQNQSLNHTNFCVEINFSLSLIDRFMQTETSHWLLTFNDPLFSVEL